MKILQIFGWVVGVHLAAFIAIFASPGCQSGPRNIPTPDATMPVGQPSAPVAFNVPASQPVDLGTPVGYNPASPSGYAAPTRPGSAAAVAITPAKPAADVTHVSRYTVGRGDSLWTIAKKNNLSVAELAKANNITTGTALKPGQTLMIPGGKVAASAPAASATDKPRDLGTLTQQSAPKPANGETVKHTVATGESLGVIARKYQVKVGELAAANNLTGPTIRPGQVLTIPGYKGVSVKTSAPAPARAAATTPSAPAPAAETPAPAAAATPHFQIAPPPPGQDLDSGLKDASTDVPTIKVEEAKPAPKI